MQVIVLHKRQLAETETDIDICICGNIRELVSSHPFPCAHFHPPSSPFLLMSLLRPRRETFCTDVAYFEG